MVEEMGRERRDSVDGDGDEMEEDEMAPVWLIDLKWMLKIQSSSM